MEIPNTYDRVNGLKTNAPLGSTRVVCWVGVTPLHLLLSSGFMNDLFLEKPGIPFGGGKKKSRTKALGSLIKGKITAK